MHPDYRYVFISYSAKNYDSALELKNLLSINNIACWMAPQSIPAGSDYASEIPEAIEKCSIFILYLSEESQESKWVPKELDLAITCGKPIIPVHMDASALKAAFNFRLTNVQRIEAFGRFTEACNELIQQIYALWGMKPDTASDSPIVASNTIGVIKPGRIIAGKYKVIHHIAKGPLTDVFLAENIATGKQWAIKAISKESYNLDNYTIYKAALSTEMRILNNLKHVGIPAIADVIEDDHILLVIMEYINGCSLVKYVGEYGPATEPQVIRWGKQLYSILQHLHSQEPPVLHNDLKPANIMLKDADLKNDQIVLIDFGVSREIRTKYQYDTVLLGTTGFASPEHYSGNTDCRSDIYAAGVTLFYLVTGRSPAEPPYGTPPIRQINPELSLGLEYIIEKCVKTNPDARYQSAQEVLADLNQIDALSQRLKKKNFIRNLFRFGK